MRLRSQTKRFGWGVAEFGVAAILLAALLPLRAAGQEKGQKTFTSAQEACEALVTAAKNNDENALIEMIGKSAKEIIMSGDPSQDQKHQDRFVKRYEEMHRLFKEPDGTTSIYVGADNWPLPIPLINKGNVWYFDGAQAKQEILYRRVGRNEISTIRVCDQLVKAQTEYFDQFHAYASKIASDGDKRDGLYWSGEPKSPIGPRIANADAGSKGTASEPFRGYYFRVLTDQGKDAEGGARNFVVGGKMTGGFAIVAFPSAYRSSGVMTFIVGQSGVVYEKDLGKKTETDAKTMKSFNPDSSWHRAEEVQEAMNAQATE